MSTRLDQDLLLGLIPLHILHHAGEGPVYGLWIIEELGRHGYKLSAGTLYPMLHRLEKSELLVSVSQRQGRRARRMYKITATGRRSLRDAKQKVRELFTELFESELHLMFGHRERDHCEPSRTKPTTGQPRANTRGPGHERYSKRGSRE